MLMRELRGQQGQAAYTAFLLLGGDSEKGMATNKRNPSPSSPDRIRALSQNRLSASCNDRRATSLREHHSCVWRQPDLGSQTHCPLPGLPGCLPRATGPASFLTWGSGVHRDEPTRAAQSFTLLHTHTGSQLWAPPHTCKGNKYRDRYVPDMEETPPPVASPPPSSQEAQTGHSPPFWHRATSPGDRVQP